MEDGIYQVHYNRHFQRRGLDLLLLGREAGPILWCLDWNVSEVAGRLVNVHEGIDLVYGISTTGPSSTLGGSWSTEGYFDVCRDGEGCGVVCHIFHSFD